MSKKNSSSSRPSSISFLLTIALLVSPFVCGCEDDASEDMQNQADAGSEPATSLELELFSWWVAPGEADALMAVFTLFSDQYPEVIVNNVASVTSEDNDALLADRMSSDNPPDLFQSHAADGVALYMDQLLDLTHFVSSNNWDQTIHASAFTGVVVDHAVYAIPTNLHRENGVFYNKSIFASLGIDPESLTSVDALLAVCEIIKGTGKTPIVTSHQGWIVRQLFNSIFLGLSQNAFENYYRGISLDEAALTEAITTFAFILENYVNADAADEISWDVAAEKLVTMEAAMFFHGDWAQGYYSHRNMDSDDYGVITSPGAPDALIYSADVFAIPKQADRQGEAMQFLKVMLSQEGQVAFNNEKGSCPVVKTIDITQMSPVSQQICNAVNNSTMQIHIAKVYPAERDWDTAFDKYIGNDSECGALVCTDLLIQHYLSTFEYISNTGS